MKSYRKELVFRLPQRSGFINITGHAEQAVRESGIKEGLLLCNSMINLERVLNDNETDCIRILKVA